MLFPTFLREELRFSGGGGGGGVIYFVVLASEPVQLAGDLG